MPQVWRFVGRNMWHAGGDYSVERLFDGMGDRACEPFERFEGFIAACGPYEVAPEKTRVVFMDGSGCGRERHGDRGITIAFGLPRPLKHPRTRRIEDYGGGGYGHWMRNTSPVELDDELLGWLRESFSTGERP